MDSLGPVFDAVWNQDPDSFPFRQPVDPHALGIPDYFDIIKHPIDLSHIQQKLDDGEYKDGWEVRTIGGRRVFFWGGGGLGWWW